MSYYTPRFHLMVSSRQEDLRHPLSISLERFPGLPLAFPKVHRACQQHSWDKVQPFPRSPAWLWPSLGSTPEFSRAAWTCICQAEGNTHLLLERLMSLAAWMAPVPATGSVHRHWVTPFLKRSAMLGPYSTLLTFLFQLPSQLILCTQSHLGALPVTLWSCTVFLPCLHAQSSMLNYLLLLPLGITKALT